MSRAFVSIDWKSSKAVILRTAVSICVFAAIV